MQVSRHFKAFANNSSVNIKLSKTQLCKKGQSGEFLGRLRGPSLKTGLPLTKNVLKPLAKRALIPLRRSELRECNIRFLSMRSVSCCTGPHVFTSFARLKKKFN